MKLAFLLPGTAVLALAFALTTAIPVRADIQMTGFRLAVAETAAPDEVIAAFYRARDFDGFWAGSTPEVQARRNALLSAFAEAGAHGLPIATYDPADLIQRLMAADTASEQGAMDVELTRLFLSYAQDLETGILTPRRVASEIRREVALRDPAELLLAFSRAEPVRFLRELAPGSAEYARLVVAKARLEGLVLSGGWGPTVAAGSLELGNSGDAVVALRNRLIAMGYLLPSATRTYDDTITAAVLAFQDDNGLTADGVAGASTIDELNVSVTERLQSVIVAMERERWLGDERGGRHVWVNLADFTAAIIDNDRVTFRTRSVIGAVSADRQTPEFSDMMEFMVINPSWSVPRSIVVNEYLPSMQSNPGAAGHIQVLDSSGREISRGNINFNAYNASNFPFAMRQAPGPRNALGFVKFMFPNDYAIYLHDTPARDLFSNEVRAFSHGCIRLADPREFAYELLSRQTADPEGLFAQHLDTGDETRVNLEVPIPVHLDYRTAFTDVSGTLQFRRDIYNRDARIWAALAAEGVEVPGVSG